ncbi:MAG TPA: hypothetical protein VFU46_08180 [Gemmatimonadales bacterium]|nr:hypothetical protein [Gemmatimonadales bacterium]
MSCGWRSLLLLAAGAAGARQLVAQRVAELGVQGLIATSQPVLAVGGIYGALRVSGRVRLAATAGAGAAGGDAAGRAELLAHFMLNPAAARGAAVYAGGGVAAVAGPLEEGYLVVLLGIEAAPGRNSGWALEAGVGGGVRVTAGYRWRWFPAARRVSKRNRPGEKPGADRLAIGNPLIRPR